MIIVNDELPNGIFMNSETYHKLISYDKDLEEELETALTT